ncbi:AcrR family transcriptional regulator [Arthrobacter stackebrandtii]|uniref:AcrR family transcriptional regulator n=1 Tax=Arthrobacter stackebrandtii TaxID=272161 RepID=A0ABS4YZB1_9MICC|nr:TetR/AcrR family transcriptional regulator [Arthrobacter stackebrandtii]MBP2414079.1 AcrR family transcriptional regulator [Arthrobacter stackebrandtii]PYG99407.1 TetR/AcrR family transcriptional regulator [Arthrobacter stackebrandtii]
MNKRSVRERPAKSRIMAAAAELFYARGISATGIDAITARAGVAKKSLYNNFASKDELVLEYLRERHQEWLDLYAARAQSAQFTVAKYPDTKTPDAEALVLAVFDAYIDHADSAYIHGFRGCGLLNAAAELPAGSPGRDAVRIHKEEVESLLRAALAESLEAATAAPLAEQLSFLLEGAVARAGLEGSSERLRHAREAAGAIVRAAQAAA